MHTFKKSESLCNYNLKKILFEKGHSFFCYPFKIQWYIIEGTVEEAILKRSVEQYTATAIEKSGIVQKQNPSFPYKKIPQNAFFCFPAKCLISVSTKKFKNATDRNYIKRLIKEAYRKNKSDIYSFLVEKNQLCLMAIIYTGKTIPTYNEIEKKIILTLQNLKKEILSQVPG